MHDRLLQLLLDPEDTGVTYYTAVAVLGQCEFAGIELIVRATALADDNTNEFLGGAFLTFRAETRWQKDSFLRESLLEIASMSDVETHRAAARDYIDWLGL